MSLLFPVCHYQNLTSCCHYDRFDLFSINESMSGHFDKVVKNEVSMLKLNREICINAHKTDFFSSSNAWTDILILTVCNSTFSDYLRQYSNYHF